jgi:hypothetical protein
MSMENHCEMISARENSRLVYRSFLAVLPAAISGSKQEELAKRVRILLCGIFLFILGNDFYMP